MAEKGCGYFLSNVLSEPESRVVLGNDYDVVVANILADVIIPMAPVLPARMKSGGILITSGIIAFKEKEVAAALEAVGLTIEEINHQGEWVNITARKK